MTTLSLIAVIVALVGLDLVVGAVVFAVLWWREHEVLRAQSEAFTYDEYRRAHKQDEAAK